MKDVAHFVKAVHVELSNEGGNIGVFEVLPATYQPCSIPLLCELAHERTLAKSALGDIMKLSLLLDQDIRFCMVGSSSILFHVSPDLATNGRQSHLYNLWMKAVCTTFGCCEEVAAAALARLFAGPVWPCVVSVGPPFRVM